MTRGKYRNVPRKPYSGLFPGVSAPSPHTFLLSHIQAASSVVMLAQAPPENHLCFISFAPPHPLLQPHPPSPPPPGPGKMPSTFCSTSGIQKQFSVDFVSLISLTPSCFAERCTFGAVLIISKSTFSTRKEFKEKEQSLVFYLNIVWCIMLRGVSRVDAVAIERHFSEVFENLNFL